MAVLHSCEHVVNAKEVNRTHDDAWNDAGEAQNATDDETSRSCV